MIRSLEFVGGEALQRLFSYGPERIGLAHKLEKYKRLFLPEPSKNWDEEKFRKRMYELVAIDELESLITLNPEMTVQDIIYEFLDELDPIIDSIDSPVETFEMAITMKGLLVDVVDWLGLYF